MLITTLAAGLVLASWIGWFTLKPLGNLERISRIPNWVVFVLVGAMLFAVLALAVLGC